MGLATEPPLEGRGVKILGMVPGLFRGQRNQHGRDPGTSLLTSPPGPVTHSCQPGRPPVPGASQACFHLRDFALVALSTWIILCPVICMAHSLISFRSLLTTDSFRRPSQTILFELACTLTLFYSPLFCLIHFIEHLLCTRHCCRHLGASTEQNEV